MEAYPKPVTLKCHQTISEQMYVINNSFYKRNNIKEFGFFCKLKYNQKIIPAIIINDYINDENFFNTINVTINNKEEIIDIDDIIYKDKKLCLSIIKIKKCNNKNIKFFEIDDEFFGKDPEMYYRNESIYCIQYTKENTFVSYGIIKEINNNEIIYTGKINSNFSLIFNLNNNKLIGINKNICKYYNRGILFKGILKKIKNYISNENEIHIYIDIKLEDKNKKIYFLNDRENDINKLNQSNTRLYINNKEEIYERYIISNKIGINEIILKFNYSLKNIENMFRDCINIIEINFINFNCLYLGSMKQMFYNCMNLEKINLFFYDIKNVYSMSGIFYGCSSLKNISDISKWNTEGVYNMSYMFYNCSSLKILPDLSKWNIKKVYDMSFMLYNCNSLNVISDISKWNTENICNMSYMFYNCSSLKILPDLYKWNMSNIKDMSYMFFSCKSLINLPDISEWDTKNVTDMSMMFGSCSSLNKLPDISKWDTKNIKNKNWIFGASIISPNKYKNNTENIKDKNEKSKGCNTLERLYNFHKKKNNNELNMAFCLDD